MDMKELLDVLMKVDALIEEFFNGEHSAVLAEAQAIIKEAAQQSVQADGATVCDECGASVKGDVCGNCGARRAPRR